MIFQRRAEPLDLVLEVDLSTLAKDWHETPEDLSDVERWVDDGLVSLRLIALKQAIAPELRDADLFQAVVRQASGKTATHKELVATASLYLLSFPQLTVLWDGHSSCAYAGGRADVVGYVPRVKHASVYVECGTLNRGKLRTGLLHGETMMLIPFADGGCKLTSEQRAALDKGAFNLDEDCLGFLFRPTEEGRSMLAAQHAHEVLACAPLF